MKNFIFVIFILFLSNCQNFDTKILETFPNGATKSYTERSGDTVRRIENYMSGEVKKEMISFDGNNKSQLISYYENGVIESTIFLKNGERCDTAIWFNEKSVIRKKNIYKSDRVLHVFGYNDSGFERYLNVFMQDSLYYIRTYNTPENPNSEYKEDFRPQVSVNLRNPKAGDTLIVEARLPMGDVYYNFDTLDFKFDFYIGESFSINMKLPYPSISVKFNKYGLARKKILVSGSSKAYLYGSVFSENGGKEPIKYSTVSTPIR